MTITVDAKPLLEAIKKVIKVTGAKTLNFNFTENKVTISAMLNQHRMELILPIECQEEAKFNIFSDALLPVLENKEKVSLDIDENSLKFKAGRSHGTLTVLTYEEIPFDNSKGNPLDDTIKTFIFKNLQRVDYSGKNVSESIPLKVQIKDGKIKMLGMEMNYSGLVVEPMDGVDDADFNILLKYAKIITEIFSVEEDLKIFSTDSAVEIYSNTCKVILPKIADGESTSIEQMENVIATNVTKDNLKGRILLKTPKDFFADIDELQKFVGNDTGARIKIIRKAENAPAEIQVNTPNGKLTKKFSDDCKFEGFFDVQYNLDNFKACIEKNLDGVMQLAIYNTFCTIKNNVSKDSIYMVIEQR